MAAKERLGIGLPRVPPGRVPGAAARVGVGPGDRVVAHRCRRARSSTRRASRGRCTWAAGACGEAVPLVRPLPQARQAPRPGVRVDRTRRPSPLDLRMGRSRRRPARRTTASRTRCRRPSGRPRTRRRTGCSARTPLAGGRRGRRPSSAGRRRCRSERSRWSVKTAASSVASTAKWFCAPRSRSAWTAVGIESWRKPAVFVKSRIRARAAQSPLAPSLRRGAPRRRRARGRRLRASSARQRHGSPSVGEGTRQRGAARRTSYQRCSLSLPQHDPLSMRIRYRWCTPIQALPIAAGGRLCRPGGQTPVIGGLRQGGARGGTMGSPTIKTSSRRSGRSGSRSPCPRRRPRGCTAARGHSVNSSSLRISGLSCSISRGESSDSCFTSTLSMTASKTFSRWP